MKAKNVCLQQDYGSQHKREIKMIRYDKQIFSALETLQAKL